MSEHSIGVKERLGVFQDAADASLAHLVQVDHMGTQFSTGVEGE